MKRTEEECRARRAATEEECAAKLKKADRDCEEKLEATEAECEALMDDAKQAARDRIIKVNRKIKLLMNKYPMLREYLAKEGEQGGTST